LAQPHGHSLSSSGHSFFLFWHLGFVSWAITPAFQFWARQRDSSFSHGQFRNQASSGLGHPGRRACLTSRSTRTPPARSAFLFRHSSLSASFVIRLRAGPVNCFR
jgi:hypothetical protein